MLVVVAIVGLLSSVVVVGVGGARQKARDTKRIADLRQIQTYLETKYVGSYPDLTTWPAELPKDPTLNTPYGYCGGGTQTYTLSATLEDKNTKPTGAVATPTCGNVSCSGELIYCVTP